MTYVYYHARTDALVLVEAKGILLPMYDIPNLNVYFIGFLEN